MAQESDLQVEKQVLKGTGECIRIFSYLPNPRLYKATIAARYSGAEVEIVGAEAGGIMRMLWDYDPRVLTSEEKEAHPEWARSASMGFRGALYKTDDFLSAHPYGNVPAAFAGEDHVGVFESNSIMRAAARAGSDCPGLYGPSWKEQSRIDSFLDRTLIFADAVQRYILTQADDLDRAMHGQAVQALESYLKGIEAALEVSRFVASDEITLADIVFVCEMALLTNEHALQEAITGLGEQSVLSRMSQFPRSAAHLRHFSSEENFSVDLGKYFARLQKHSWW